MFLPKTLPHVYMNDRHFASPNANSLRSSECCSANEQNERLRPFHPDPYTEQIQYGITRRLTRTEF
jgi:hypothetical protein